MTDCIKKTRLFIRKAADPFFVDCFNENDIDLIIQSVFRDDMHITVGRFLELMNNIISYLGSFYPSINTLTPGKTDELSLIKKIQHHSSHLLEYIDTLLNQYGYETWQHINLYSPWGKEVNTRLSLDGLYEACQMLNVALPITLQHIKKSSGKKTGNNSLQAIPCLISYLIPIYEEVTNKSVSDNFHQDRKHGSLRYTGQFLDFVRTVLLMIKSKYDQLYPKNKDDNPFVICLAESSTALGKHIQKTILGIKNKHHEVGQSLFDFYFTQLVSIQPRSEA